MSINNNDTLILRTDGTFDAFMGACQLQVGGSWAHESNGTTTSSIEERRDLSLSSLIDFCSLARKMCDKVLEDVLKKSPPAKVCDRVAGRIGQRIGIGVGSLGDALGPEVGIPTTLLGGALGQYLGSQLCDKGIETLSDTVCDIGTCEQADYEDEDSKGCSHGKGIGKAIFCCTGSCIDGSSVGKAGLCRHWLDPCEDLEQDTSSLCSSDQVLRFTGSDWIDSGDGKCWINASDCRWQRQKWKWSCCSCRKGFERTSNTIDKCYDNNPPSPCVGCTGKGQKLVGNGLVGYYCVSYSK
jgi:hypothetical protein